MTHWNEMTEAQQLVCIYSDTHKDVFGSRPRHMTQEQIESVEWLSNAIAKLEEMPMHDDGANEYDDFDEYDGQPDEYTEWQDYMGGDEYYDHSENCMGDW